jgi:hypothetical protein
MRTHTTRHRQRRIVRQPFFGPTSANKEVQAPEQSSLFFSAPMSVSTGDGATNTSPFFASRSKSSDGKGDTGASVPASSPPAPTASGSRNLTAPRFKGNSILEAALDGNALILEGSSGHHVTLLQQALTDDGFRLPKFGADGKFGPETSNAMKAYQGKYGLDADGIVGQHTMGQMDTHFGGSPITPPPPAPPGPSPAPKPKPAPGPAPVAIPTVTFSPNQVRYPTTPVPMSPHRIPPRRFWPIGVGLTGHKPPMAPVEIFVEGSGVGTNGTVLVNGGSSAFIAGPMMIILQGTVQTGPGSAGQLRLAAKFAGNIIARSDPFSVSSIPQDYTDVLSGLVDTSTRKGIIVQDGWQSDSGVLADLDQAEISEIVEYTGGTGAFAGTTSGKNSGYLSATSLSKDTHSFAASQLTGPGYLLSKQVCIFRDKRTGATDIPMTNSGYHIERNLWKPHFWSSLRFKVHKFGQDTTAKSYTSAAGAGDAEHTFVL